MASEKVVFKNKINNYYIIIQTSEAKREEFTKYLEEAGVVENLTEILIDLYEEDDKPKYPTDYIKSNLRSSKTKENEILLQNIKFKEENRVLKERIKQLEKGIERLKKKLKEKSK